MIWQNKLILIVAVAAYCYIAYGLYNTYFGYYAAPSSDSVFMAGLGFDASIYDPALAKDTRSKYGLTVLAFSNERKTVYTDDLPFHPTLRLAFSENNCLTFNLSYVQQFHLKDAELKNPETDEVIAKGVWRMEGPGITFDPDDRGREWKLYAYKYFWPDNEDFSTVEEYSGIVEYVTTDPMTGSWKGPVWRFTAKESSPLPDVKTSLNVLDDTLKDVTLYSRPSVIQKDGQMMMTLSAFTGGKKPDRVIMLSSADRGETWRYVATVLTLQDIKDFSGPQGHLGGATLLQQNDTVYLAAVFGDENTYGTGTHIFDFEDLIQGRLKRDENGILSPRKIIPLQSVNPNYFGGGYAAYHDGCRGGIFTGEVSGTKRFPQIFRTHETPAG